MQKKKLTLNNGKEITYDKDYTEYLRTLLGEQFIKAVYKVDNGDTFVKNSNNITTKDSLFILTYEDRLVQLSGSDEGYLCICSRFLWVDIK